MTQTNQPAREELQVDRTNLYREDVFTDLQTATLRRLTPVKDDGSDDPSRPVIFVGATQLMSQAGPIPVSAELDATDLRGAIEKFPGAIRDAIAQMVEEAREMQRRESSRLVVPGAGGIPPTGGKGPLSFR